jgi:hypothetical protein
MTPSTPQWRKRLHYCSLASFICFAVVFSRHGWDSHSLVSWAAIVGLAVNFVFGYSNRPSRATAES